MKDFNIDRATTLTKRFRPTIKSNVLAQLSLPNQRRSLHRAKARASFVFQCEPIVANKPQLNQQRH